MDEEEGRRSEREEQGTGEREGKGERRDGRGARYIRSRSAGGAAGGKGRRATGYLV